MGRKRHEGLLILRVRRGRRLEARPVRPQYSKAFTPDVRAEGRHLTLRLQRKKEVIPVVEHRAQDRLDDQIIGIDQHVVRLKPGERQDQMQDGKGRIPQERVPKCKPPVGDRGWQRLVEA